MKLTVFTPTYNRKDLLPRLYESLKRQTCKDFMWLIVDDGSTDGTSELIESFKSENKVIIEYIYRENGGKMRAHNDGVKNCKTPYFLCVDSDDYIVDTAVEDLLSVELSGNKLAGVISHKGKSETELLSDVPFPEGISRTSLYNLYLKGFKGETTIMFVTDVIREFPFPEIENEKYVPEDYIYDKIDAEYEYIVLDKIITVCEIVSEGYTDSVVKLKNNNPVAFYMYYEQRAIITPLSVLKIKYAGFFVKYARKCGKKFFNTKLKKIYVVIGIIASVFINE
ncbi:MAG: glycosyltransferase family 2 protein [Lachnospiraceae bacterium]|nr:glycosyltransferase family 2 protein [Lachnospiraceae bacterium]